MWPAGGGVARLRKPAISLKLGKTGPMKYWWPIESRIGLYALSIGTKINDLGWPWRAITHSLSKHVRLSEPTTKIWMKVDYTVSDIDVAQWLDSGNIRFMGIFAGVPWKGGVIYNSGVIENVFFSGLRTLRIRHLRKWGQHYYIVLFSPYCRLSTDPEIRDLDEWLLRTATD